MYFLIHAMKVKSIIIKTNDNCHIINNNWPYFLIVFPAFI